MSNSGIAEEGETKSTNEPNTDLNNGSTVESQELNELERDIMKGDTVGDTVYSALWIINTLKTLPQITDETFNSDIETDLCMFWDMTADKDVLEFIMKFDIFHIIDHTLKCTSNPRLTEILLGIVGNISCNNEALNSLLEKETFVEMIFDYLNCDDAETLIQIIRVFKSIMWVIQTNKTSPWTEKFDDNSFGKHICFILMSSKHEHLLTATLDLVEQITTISSEGDKLLEKWFDLGELILSIFECFNQLFENEIELAQNELLKIKNWLTIYLYIINVDTFETSVQFEKETIYSKATKVIEQILKSFPLGYTIPLSDDAIYCIGTCVDIMMWFLKNKGYYETFAIAMVPSLLVALKSDLEATAVSKVNLTQEIELIEYLQKSWLYILNVLDQQNLHITKIMCENILKNEREMTHEDLRKLIQSLNITGKEEKLN